MPAMMTLTDTLEQLAKIDAKIISLLEERMRICDGQHFTSDELLETISLYVEEAADKGIDSPNIEKLAKIIILICRRGAAE